MKKKKTTTTTMTTLTAMKILKPHANITKHVGPGKSLRHIAEYIEHMQFWSNRLGPVHPDGQNDSDEDDASREVEVVLNPQLLLREDKTILEHVHREERVMVPHIMQMIQDIDSDNGDRGEIVDHPAVHMFHRKMVDNLATMFYKETPYALSPALYTDMAGELEKFLRRIIARLITKLMVKGRVYPEEDGLPQLETSKLDVRLAIRDEGFGDKLRMSVAQDRIRRFYDTHRYRQSFALTTNKRRSGNLNINPDWFESTTEYNYADGDGSVALRDFIIDDDPVYKCAAPSSRYDDDDDDDHDDSETSDDDASPDSSDGD
ncbi:hypothetical protein FBU59_002406 [Linderina macrospora]|uniref:Uncharacterized protein n=1 Tax=Linderina macrospora TaxID=4868 RepID=A0ACC1JBJ2_9FUNG|nr:hypothetical protein FBU59_002406 [Linderina macrospora]